MKKQSDVERYERYWKRKFSWADELRKCIKEGYRKDRWIESYLSFKPHSVSYDRGELKRFERYWAKCEERREMIRRHELTHMIVSRAKRPRLSFEFASKDIAKMLARNRGLKFIEWSKASKNQRALAKRYPHK